MKSETIKRVQRIFGIILGISIAVAGICLIVGCLHIYNSGPHPYSRDSVASVFSAIAVPIFICLALVIASFVFNCFVPEDVKKDKPVKPYRHLLKKLSAQKDISQCDIGIRGDIEAQRKYRKILFIILATILTCSTVDFLVYALNPDNYGTDINLSVINAMKHMLPSLIIAFIYSIYCLKETKSSIITEIELLKLAPKAEITTEVAKKVDLRRFVSAVRIIIPIIALVALVYGFINGGTSDVLTKAVNICTECIGLG